MEAKELTFDEVAQEYAARRSEPSSPGGWYSPDGDCYFFHAEDVPYQAIRLAGLVTLFEALDDHRPVGIQIKGIQKLVRECQQLRLLIESYEDFDLMYLLRFALTFSRAIGDPDRDAVHIRELYKRSDTWRVPAKPLREVLAGA